MKSIYNVFFVCLLLPITALGSDFVVRDSDLLHFDIREIVNRTDHPLKLSFELDLCAGPNDPGQTTSRIECRALGASSVIDVDPRPEDAHYLSLKTPPTSKMMNGAVDRLKGSEINAIALQLKQTLQTQGQESVVYRLQLQMIDNSGVPNVVARQFGLLPGLEVESPVDSGSDRGVMVDRHVLENPTQQFNSRVLIVLTRKGKRSND